MLEATRKIKNKNSYINKKKHEGGITVTVKLVCNKCDSSSRIRHKFFWMILIIQTKVMQILFLQTCQLKLWALRMMVERNSSRQSRGFRSCDKASNICFNTNKISPVNTSIQVGCISQHRHKYLDTLVFLTFI